MDKQLTVRFTRTYDHKPLAVIRNLPGLDVDMLPAQMRALAAVLVEAASDCEARPMGKRTFSQTTRTYDLNW